MFEQLRANVAVNLKFYRRNRLLLAIGLLFIFIVLLAVGSSLLFSTQGAQFTILHELYLQLVDYAFIFVAAVGLVLVTSTVRGRAIKLIFTKPCTPDTWVASAFASAIVLSFVLHAAILAFTLILSLSFGLPVQNGFFFFAGIGFFRSIIAMSYLTLLAMLMHPVLAVIVVLIFNEGTFGFLRTGLLASIRNDPDSFLLPVLEKITFAFYVAVPMFSPFAGEYESAQASMRVEAGQWKYLAYTGAYAITLCGLLFLLTLAVLRRKNLP